MPCHPLIQGETVSHSLKRLVLGGLLIAAFGLVLGVLIPFAVRVPASVKLAALSPDFWPRIIAAGIVLLGMLVAGQGIMGIRRRGGSGSAEWFDKAEILRIAAAGFGLLVYYAALEPLGIVAASVLALPAFSLLYGERRIKVLVPLGVLLPVALYFFFTRVANIPMPLGVFG